MKKYSEEYLLFQSLKVIKVGSEQNLVCSKMVDTVSGTSQKALLEGEGKTRL